MTPDIYHTLGGSDVGRTGFILLSIAGTGAAAVVACETSTAKN